MPAPYIFLSHSSHNRPFTADLAAKLHEAGYRCWLDIEDIPDGSTWMREIEKGVVGCGAMIVVMSQQGRDSEWVERETLMAMELGKPLLIARIDDAPLPLHLINRQFTDFRDKPEAALKKLLVALQKVPLTEPLPAPDPQEQKRHSPEPNRLNFFKYLEQLPDGETNVRTAHALFDWAKDNVDSLTFSGRSEPAFHANLWVGPGGVTVCSVRAYPKMPAVEIPLQHFKPFPPYDDRAERQKILERLNGFMTEPFEEIRADKLPHVPLIAFAEDAALQAFIAMMDEIIQTLRAAPEINPSSNPDQP
jgi:hypothetical protein